MAQGSNYARDRAHAPLFAYVDEEKLKSIETFARKFEFAEVLLLSFFSFSNYIPGFLEPFFLFCFYHI